MALLSNSPWYFTHNTIHGGKFMNMHDTVKDIQARKMVDEGINFIQRNALTFRRNCLGERLSPDQDVFAGMGFQDMINPMQTVEYFLTKSGVAFKDTSSASSLLHRAFTTSDLSEVLREAGQPLLIDSYNEAPATFRAWTIPHVVQSYRSVTLAGAAVSGLELVAEGAEYPEADFRHSYGVAQIKSYGARFAISYEAYLEGHYGLIRDGVKLLGRAAAMKANALACEALLSNPRLSDGEVLFSDDRGTEVIGDMDATGLSNACKALRSMTDPAGNILNLGPAAVLVPPALEVGARALCKTMNDVQNPFELSLVPVVEPLLAADAGGSDSTWYLCARPEDGAAFAQLALTPRAEPTVRTKANYNTDMLEWLIRLDTAIVAKSGIGMVRVVTE